MARGAHAIVASTSYIGATKTQSFSIIDPFYGTLDDIAVYNHTLTDQDR